MFNKVMTAQYYMWYTAFWPIILINNRFLTERPYLFGGYIFCWGLGQGFWGYFANEFETNGEQTLVMIQAANFLWLAINMTGAMLFLSYQDLHL